MSLQMQFVEMKDYLAVRFIGKITAEEIWRQFESIAERCKRANKNKLLLNLLEAQAIASLAERYFLAEEARIFAQYEINKTAIIDIPARIDPHRFGELVARNRGINARAFTNVEDAEAWLLN